MPCKEVRKIKFLSWPFEITQTHNLSLMCARGTSNVCYYLPYDFDLKKFGQEIVTLTIYHMVLHFKIRDHSLMMSDDFSPNVRFLPYKRPIF